ncbi:MAG TPA: hypothetical protein VLK85_34805 [Ramlibacter sp.]|nr:hypothetical protein [Ramlibacter sp.]
MSTLNRLIATCGAPARAALPCVARHRAFVSRVAPASVARVRVQPVSLVLRRQRVAAGQGGAAFFARSWTLVLSPRLTAVVSQVRSVVHGPVLQPRQVSVQRLVPVAMPVHRLHTVLHAHSQVGGHVTRHELRTEAPTVRVLRTTRVERHSAYPRVSVVMARSAAPVPVPAVPAQAVTPMPQAGHRVFAERGQPALATSGREPLPPQELARVTDHVLAQLDRKVLSYAERHARR